MYYRQLFYQMFRNCPLSVNFIWYLKYERILLIIQEFFAKFYCNYFLKVIVTVQWKLYTRNSVVVGLFFSKLRISEKSNCQTVGNGVFTCAKIKTHKKDCANKIHLKRGSTFPLKIKYLYYLNNCLLLETPLLNKYKF